MPGADRPWHRVCGSESHEYELNLAVEDIDHARTKTKSPETNGIGERFHRTILDEFYRVAFQVRKKIRPTPFSVPWSLTSLRETLEPVNA